MAAPVDLDDPALTPTAPAFSSQDQGTAEGQWRTALLRRPPLALPATVGHVVVVSPHPDDEVLGCGGLLRTLAERGWRTTVVSVTDGEQAYPDAPDLAAIRRAELDEALIALGVPAAVERLGLPDGGVARHEDELGRALAPILGPANLILVPWECDGHPDHDATGRATRQAGAGAGRLILRFPVWAWHWSSPDAPWFAFTRVLPLTDAVRAAKADAVRAFASQHDGRRGDPVLPPWVLTRFARRYETFIP